MIVPGGIVQDVKGGKYEVDRELAQGGQGVVWLARERTTGVQRILKVYHPDTSSPEAERRLDALVRADLSARSVALCGPIARLHPSHGLGAVQPFAEGETLADLYEHAMPTLMDALGIAVAVCRTIALLEDQGIAHGDLSASNLLVHERGSHWEIRLIDTDNAAVPGVPPPLFRGQEPYIAPEILLEGKTPSVESDRFALGVLLHELLLQRHPFATAVPADAEFEEYLKVLERSEWWDDPSVGHTSGVLPGLPVGVLPRSVHALFRAALQTDPKQRPTARAWAEALAGALRELYVCDACGQAFSNDPSVFRCPYCGAEAGTLALALGGRVVPFTRLSTTLGRDDLGGDPTLSREHADFRRRGFGLLVTNLSTNGLRVQARGRWHDLDRGEEIVVSVGDQVAFAPGVEAAIVFANAAR